MAGLQRYMAALRLFNEAQPTWTVPDMADALGAPQSTVYRTIRDLLAEGLVEASTDARYRLGPAFIEFDRLTRLTDPLLRAGAHVLEQTVTQAGLPCVGLLSRLYADEVMCIADRASGDARFLPSYERGRPMPLTQGATSKVILARLPARRLAKLLAHAGKAQDAALKRELATVRRQGFLVSRGEIDAGLAGLAAPIVCEDAGLVASLSLVVEAERLDAFSESRLVLMLVSAGAMIERALQTTNDTTVIARSEATWQSSLT
jgi:DNA-binding IclR family transcriptional regulator